MAKETVIYEKVHVVRGQEAQLYRQSRAYVTTGTGMGSFSPCAGTPDGGVIVLVEPKSLTDARERHRTRR